MRIGVYCFDIIIIWSYVVYFEEETALASEDFVEVESDLEEDVGEFGLGEEVYDEFGEVSYLEEEAEGVD